MKAAELRIGNNLLLYGVVVTVVGIDKSLTWGYHVTYSDEETEYRTARWIDQFEPIPLTEEWFERFGFSKRLDGNYVHKEDYSLEVFFHDSGFEVMVDSCCKNHCKHVHTLQNLYFALTGEELELKDK